MKNIQYLIGGTILLQRSQQKSEILEIKILIANFGGNKDATAIHFAYLALVLNLRRLFCTKWKPCL